MKKQDYKINEENFYFPAVKRSGPSFSRICFPLILTGFLNPEKASITNGQQNEFHVLKADYQYCR